MYNIIVNYFIVYKFDNKENRVSSSKLVHGKNVKFKQNIVLSYNLTSICYNGYLL